MKVAVPLLQHSQWFGHLALSQTVCRRRSSRRARVWKKLLLVGSLMRSHSGRRTRGTVVAEGMLSLVTILRPEEYGQSLLTSTSTTVKLRRLGGRVLEAFPEFFQLIGVEIGEDFAIDFDTGSFGLAREVEHFLAGG